MFSVNFLAEISLWAKNFGQGYMLILPFGVLFLAILVLLGVGFSKKLSQNINLLASIVIFFLGINIATWVFIFFEKKEQIWQNGILKSNSIVVGLQILMSVLTVFALTFLFQKKSLKNLTPNPSPKENGDLNNLTPNNSPDFSSNHAFIPPYIEYLVGWIGILLGGQVAISTTHFLVLYLGFELMGIGAYFLSGYIFIQNKNQNNREIQDNYEKIAQKTAENSLTYLLFGAFATAVMLYGISWVYGLTGGLDFVALKNLPANETAFLAIFLVSIGFLLKISAIPVHFWTVEIYETAHISLVAFISNIPKIAGIFAFLHFLDAISIISQKASLLQLLALISIITLSFGNFMAMNEKNARRMFAFSSIAHAGFLLFPLLFLPQKGAISVSAILFFYVLVYSIANVGVWIGLEILKPNNAKNYDLDVYTGLGKRYPVRAIAICILMLALAGLPPTAVFWGKFFIFSGLWQLAQTGDTLWLLVFIGAILNTVVALGYYFKLPYYLFFKIGETENNTTENPTSIKEIVFYVCVVVLLGLFLSPNV